MPLGFTELPNLQLLKLGGNLDLRASCSQLLRGSWEKIQVLDFAYNKIHGRLPASIAKMSSLTYLDLFLNGVKKLLAGENHLVGHLPNWLGELKNLVELDLSSNSLEGPIPASLGNFQNLSELQLRANKLNGTLPDSLGQLSNLNFLDVSMNELSGVISEVHFSTPTKLDSLDLSENSFIFNVSSDWIPPFQLIYLYLGSCHLGSIPSNISKIMYFFSLSNNQMTVEIPNSIGKLKSVRVIDLSRNHFIGSIPSSIGNFSGLSALDLQNNNLSGEIPSSLSELHLLRTLHLRATGNIPPWVGEAFPHLRILGLRSNDFSGEIPPAISNLSSLQVLDLANDALNGKIPASFDNSLSGAIQASMSSITALSYLDVSNNNLSGVIPYTNQMATLMHLVMVETHVYVEVLSP
ncbi:hypothetical protein JCGZ_09915 [Jatropha curcas]|uniref:Leucine-rich repeat-containing N-terminal plant-type domain-containing protein n=1 Tax=Jatropha curcas TaxID=180498 RepID=A0A067KLQ7_JATCU|nr:hypothetical protein JCGZ_09915 [Jatropha curcas]